MIQAKRLGHIVLNVRNAEKSRDFYTQTLGLKVAHENLERGEREISRLIANASIDVLPQTPQLDEV